MTHRFAIDLLKEKRDEITVRLRHYFQTKNAEEKLKKQVVEINRAIFVLLKDARK